MIKFSDIAINYLKDRGYEPYECESENEARTNADELINSKKWPCYFFKSDTTGEKDFEEFFTDQEDLDMASFETIGIIRNQPEFDEGKLNKFKDQIILMLERKNWKKDELVELFLNFLPDFAHMETGKYLDQKM